MHVFKTHYRFFPIVIHNCHVCSISYHLRCWTLTFVQQESKHAWSCLGKTSHPKEHIQHLCGKVAIYRSHQTTSSKQFEFLGDRGGRVCLVVLPYRSLVHHRIWELFSASLTLESQGLPRIWRDFRIVQVIHKSCLPCEYDTRHIILVGQALSSKSGPFSERVHVAML